MSAVEDRALAAFLGFAIGDALGATVEFMTTSEIRAAHGVHRTIIGGGWLRLKPGEVTDDTEMALALARSLVKCRGLDLPDVCGAFADWLRTGPRDVGNTCRRGIRRFIADGSVEGPPHEGDAGNGAVMRVLPIGLACLGDSDRLERWSVAQGRITHNHPLSDAACQTLAAMLGTLVLGEGEVGSLARALVATRPIFRFEPYHGLSSAYVVDTVRTVFWGFFSATSFEDCLVRVVNQGGDADTAGALAGMLAGAAYGMAAIPVRWLRALKPQVGDEIRRLVPELLALSLPDAAR